MRNIKVYKHSHAYVGFCCLLNLKLKFIIPLYFQRRPNKRSTLTLLSVPWRVCNQFETFVSAHFFQWHVWYNNTIFHSLQQSELIFIIFANISPRPEVFKMFSFVGIPYVLVFDILMMLWASLRYNGQRSPSHRDLRSSFVCALPHEMVKCGNQNFYWSTGYRCPFNSTQYLAASSLRSDITLVKCLIDIYLCVGGIRLFPV